MNSITVNINMYDNTANKLLDGLDARSKDIVMRRYGINNGLIETLESIGKEYGVTRERVRQIETQAKRLLARRDDLLADIAEEIQKMFAVHGGVMSEDHLVETMPSGKANVMLFYLDIMPPYEFVTKSPVFGPHWSHPQLHSQYAETVVEAAQGLLKKEGHPKNELELIVDIRYEIGVDEEALPNECIYSMLKASKQLTKTVFGEWGLKDWIETRPRGVGDKAYITLRRHGKPEHFRMITELINEAKFDNKRAHAQTVHNELIKDARFVLVGRGLYGLKEWGFVPGTVADVLVDILTKASTPLTREELLDRVLEQRMVKKTTVLLGLQNSTKFEKVSDGRYTLRS